MPAPPKALPVIIKDRVWEWIENCVGMIINLKRVGAPKRQAVRVKPPGPVLVANAAHDSYESLYGYMGEQDSFHKCRKMLHREAGCATLEVVWPCGCMTQGCATWGSCNQGVLYFLRTTSCT